MKFKSVIVKIAAITVLTLALSACGNKTVDKQADDTSVKSSYGEKTIKVISTFPEDRTPVNTAKTVTNAISKNTGWNFEYQFAPENNGDDAVKAVYNAPHDGYTILLQAETIFGNSVSGITTQTMKDWTTFEIFSAATVVMVKGDSQYKTLTDIIDAAKANPGSIKFAHAYAPGSGFGLKVRLLEKITGAKFEITPGVVPLNAVGELNDNKYDAVIIPLVIGSKDILAGNVKVLAMADRQDLIFPEPVGIVSSVSKYYPEFENYMPLDGPQGFAMPKDTPQDVIDAFSEAFEAAVNTPEVEEYIKAQDGIKLNIMGDIADEYVGQIESTIAWLQEEFGLATSSPETLGIAKPNWMK